jgi:hypothetical protein
MTAQITLFRNDFKTLRAEAPGKNGSRLKIELDQIEVFVSSAESLADTIRENALLLAQQIIMQEQAIKKEQEKRLEHEKFMAHQRHIRTIEYTAAHYPSALKFIDPTVLQPSENVVRKLRREGFNNSEIERMAQSGELVGRYGFFTTKRIPSEDDLEIEI